MELNKKQLEDFTKMSMQSVRHCEYEGVFYAIYITNRFTKIGWMAEIGDKFYGTTAKMKLDQKDDIIDFYLAIDKNAIDTIKSLRVESPYA